MYDNGVVSFSAPGTPGALPPGQWSSTPIGTSGYNYFIAPLWADLYPVAGSEYTTVSGPGYQRYNWYNLAEYYSAWGGSLRLNSFSLTIRDTGSITTNYYSINLLDTNVSVGYAGNSAAGEYQLYHFSTAGTAVTGMQDWSYQGADPCVTDPLSSPTCPGYEQAYLEQQCSISQLYSPQCPGYQEAYLSQQCQISALFSPQCPGYAQAIAKNVDTRTENISAPAVIEPVIVADAQASPTNTDVGGVEISTTGEIVVASDVPQVTKEAAKESTSAPVTSASTPTERRVAVSIARILNIVRNSDAEAKSVAQDSATSSTSDSSNPLAAATTGRVGTASEVSDSSQVLEIRQTSSQTQTNNQATSRAHAEERERTVASSVRNGGSVGELSGGADINAMSRPPEGFGTYLGTVLRDTQFYQQREIYKNQRNVDNQRLLRQLGGTSSEIYQRMVDQQYKNNKGERNE